MTLRLKTRLTLSISLLVLLVLSVTYLLTLSTFTQGQLDGLRERGNLISQQIYGQVIQALDSAPDTLGPLTSDTPEGISTYLHAVFRQDPGLTSLLNSTIGYAPTIFSLAVTDADGIALAHSNPKKLGQRLEPVEDLQTLLDAGLLTQFRILEGPAKNYEVRFSMVDSNSDTQFGDVRVVMSTAFVQRELETFVKSHLRIGIYALALAALVAAFFSHFLLSPLTFISAGIERMARGQFDKPIQLQRRDEFGLVSLKLNEIGQQLEGRREEIDTLKGNIGQIVKSLEEKLIFLNPTRHIILLSQSAASLLRTTVEESMGKRLDEVISPSHPLIDLVETAFGVRHNLTGSQLIFPDLDKVLTAQVHFLEEKGHSMGALITFQDPETVAKLENQLEYAKKLSALNRLTSGIAHEVKNPLNAIVIHLELLRSKISPSSGEVEESLSIITQEIKRLDRVVRNFLNFNRPLEVNFQELQVQPIVQEVVALAKAEARRRNVEILVQNHEVLPKVRLDPDLIKQCLLNVVLNGCQAMTEGGRLKIACYVQRGTLEIDVHDTGPGIPAETREKIFNLYYTTKQKGSGIGLATVFKIVQLHNGEISFDSVMDVGTTFRLKFPLS